MMGESLKKILMMAGGTGGHIFPAIAIAKKLQEYGAEIHWLGTRHGLEATLIPELKLPIHYISVTGIRGKGILALFLFPLQMLIACSQTLYLFLKIKPHCVLGMGGFVSGPGGLIAWLLRKPLMIHEQNAVMGLTNKMLSKLAEKVLLAAVVGNPVREEIVAIEAPSERFAGRSGPLRLLVLGGSLGALALNQLVLETLAGLSEKDRPDVWHQSGALHDDALVSAYREKNILAKIEPFIEDMAVAYAWADCVVCRAGAMTISELMAAGVASILVPFPFSVDDHQTHNTEQLVQAGAAICIQQRDLSPAVLMQLLADFSQDRPRLLKMAQAARDLNKNRGHAAEKIARICLECSGQNTALF